MEQHGERDGNESEMVEVAKTMWLEKKSTHYFQVAVTEMIDLEWVRDPLRKHKLQHSHDYCLYNWLNGQNSVLKLIIGFGFLSCE